MGWSRKQGNTSRGRKLMSLVPLSRVCVAVMVTMMMAVVSVSGQAPCSLDDVTVMDNFDVSRFLGKWFEIVWIAPTWHDSATMWINYYTVYKANDFGLITGYYSAKDPQTGQCFLGGIVNMNSSKHPAKLVQYTQWTDTTTTLEDYWILDTDYTSYSVAYSCVVKAGDANNTCTTARSWLWSRTKSLPQSVIDRAKATFQDLCMNSTLLYVTNYKGDDCEHDASGAQATARASGNILLLVPSVVLLLFMFLKVLSIDIVP